VETNRKGKYITSAGSEVMAYVNENSGEGPVKGNSLCARKSLVRIQYALQIKIPMDRPENNEEYPQPRFDPGTPNIIIKPSEEYEFILTIAGRKPDGHINMGSSAEILDYLEELTKSNGSPRR